MACLVSRSNRESAYCTHLYYRIATLVLVVIFYPVQSRQQYKNVHGDRRIGGGVHILDFAPRSPWTQVLRLDGLPLL
jgi:hypothetical protein